MVIEFLKYVLSVLIHLAEYSIVPLIWWLITARKKENFFSWLGLKKPEPEGSVLKTILIVVGALLVYISAATVAVMNYRGKVTLAGENFKGYGLAGIPFIILMAYIMTGLSEEIFCRGFLLKKIQNKFGFLAGNLTQALIFGLVHGIPFGLVTHSWIIGIALTFFPGALGFVMGWVNEKRMGGSIIPTWLLHSTMNLAAGIVAMLI